ncbi:MAG: glycosyltransferase family 25 protein [Gemmobacter sp.]|jgi:glycosyl transferase family 25|nr:glycosyltransferase family 25 protein [Gemmobacter sp.]
MRCEVLLINLDGSAARLAQAAAVLAAAGIAFQRLPAFDGRGLRPDELPLYSAAGAVRCFGRALTGGEVGCFLSHLEAVRRFLASDAEYGLVLEDDLTATAGAADLLTHVLARLEAGAARKLWWLVNLGKPAQRMMTPLAAVNAEHGLMRAHYFPVTTTAILWNRTGAEAFLRDANEIVMPVDHWLRQWATLHDTGLALNPPLFPATEEGPSDIDTAGHRKKVPRGGLHFLARQTRLWRNKLRAWRHRRQF